MTELNNINKKDYLYDTDSNLIFNFTPEQVEYVYTLNQQETTEVLTVKQLDTKLKLAIQSVECCQSLEKDPILLILTNDQEKTIRIFFYRVFTKQATEVTMTYPAIQQDISKASITQDPFNVGFMDKKASKTESGYGLVLGLVTGVTMFILIRINWNSFEATCLSMELMEQKKNSDLGYVTAIQILPPDKEDKRMGHSDPRILLGYSQGAILVYRYRTKIYATNAKRLRAPVDLSEFTEFPKYPISCLSGVRSYHSLGMTIAFAQKKPSNNKKYEHSRSYVKIVETHGDSTRKQRRIMYSDHPDAMIVQSKLLLTPFKTHDLESIIQLSIVFINKKKSFELEVWHIAPKHLRQSDKIEVNQDKCLALLPGRKLSSDNLLEYFQHTPQKLAQVILEYEHTKSSSSSSTKRKVGLVVDEKEEEKVSCKKAKTNQEDQHTPQELAQFILEPEHTKSSLTKRKVGLVLDEEEEEKVICKKVKTDQEENEDINMQDPEHTVILKGPEGGGHQNISMPVETNKCLDDIVPEGSAEDTQSLKHHQEQSDSSAEHHQEQLEQSTMSDDNSVKESEDQYLNPISEHVVLIDNVSHTNESSLEPKSNESDIEESSIKDMEIEDKLALNDLVIRAMEEGKNSIVEEGSTEVGDHNSNTEKVVHESIQQSIESNDDTMDPIEPADNIMEYIEETTAASAIKEENSTVVSQSSDVEEIGQINSFDQVSESNSLLLQSDDMDAQDSEVEEYITPEATLNSEEEEEEEEERVLLSSLSASGRLEATLNSEEEEGALLSSLSASGRLEATLNSEEEEGALLSSLSASGRLEGWAFASVSQETTPERNLDATAEESGDERAVAAVAAAAAAAAAAAENEEKEANMKSSEEMFKQFLYTVTKDSNLNNFMEKPLVPREKLDEIGLYCWFNPDPRLKLIFIRYCDKHELGSVVVPLCYRLRNQVDCFSQNEQKEYKAIYKKYLKNNPMYNTDINVARVFKTLPNQSS